MSANLYLNLCVSFYCYLELNNPKILTSRTNQGQISPHTTRKFGETENKISASVTVAFLPLKKKQVYPI